MKRISGTIIAAICGLSPWSTPMDAWLQIKGYADPIPDNEFMRWGRTLEPVIAERYQEEHEGTDLIIPAPLPLVHPNYDFWSGSPDRLINGRNILEIKTAGVSQAKYWGPPGTDILPEQYYCQGQWYCGLVGADYVDFAVLIGGNDYREYRVPRDDEMLAMLREAAEQFWRDHVLTGTPPPVDSSPAWGKYLAKVHPQDDKDIILVDIHCDDIGQDIRHLADIKKEMAWLEAEQREYENKIKAAIGDHGGIRGDWGKITWKKAKDSRKVNWEALARELNASEKMIADFTETKPGARRFLANIREDV